MIDWSRASLIIFAMIFPSCDQPSHHSHHDPVSVVFEKRLTELEIEYELRDDGRYDVNFGGEQTSVVSLDNKRREYERNQDPEIIYEFIEQTKRSHDQSNRSWEEVKPFLRFQLEPDTYEDFSDDTLNEPVADGLLKIYVHVSSDEQLITWVTGSMIQDWNTNTETVKGLAEENMNRLVSEASLEIEEIGGVPLGMLSIEAGAFKASLLLAPHFKNLVSERLGYPVYAVAPDRDFVYIIPIEHTSFLGRLGPSVREQFENSGYPITNKVLEIGDDGISIAGTFSKPDDSNP